MPANVFQRSIQDEAGNVMPGASVEVRDQVTSNLVQLYSDYDATTPIGNPVTADADGFVRFYVATGRYRIEATSGDQERVWENEVLGILGSSIEIDRTAAEIAAGVLPTNKQYPAGHLYRYGTNTVPGTTNMATALQAALNVGGDVYIPPEQVRFNTGVTYTALGQRIYGCGTQSFLYYTGSSIAISMAAFDYTRLQDVRLWAPSASIAVYVGNICHFAKVIGCDIRGSSTGANASGTISTGIGVHVEQSFYVEVTGCDINAFTTGLLGTNQCNGNFFALNSIRRCVRGIWMRDVTANSDGNTISHNEIEGGETGDIAAIDIEGCSSMTIAENRLEYFPTVTATIIVRKGVDNSLRIELLHNHMARNVASISIGDSSGSGEVQNCTIQGGFYGGSITIGVSASYTKVILDGRSLASGAAGITNNSVTTRFSLYNDQAFAVGITGGTTTPSSNWLYSIAENVVTIEATQILVTSNTTACTITGLPTLIRPTNSQTVMLRVRDNSTTILGVGVISSAGVITLSNSLTANGTMTGSNDKGLMAGTITYRLG